MALHSRVPTPRDHREPLPGPPAPVLWGGRWHSLQQVSRAVQGRHVLLVAAEAPPGPAPASPPLPAGARQAPCGKPHRVVVGKCPRSDPRWGLWVMQAPLRGDGPHVMAQHTKTKKCEAAHRKVLAAACPESLSRLLPDPPAWRGRETFPREAVAQRTEDRRWPQAAARAEVPVTATQEDRGSAREGGWKSGLDLQRNWGAVHIGVTPLGLSRGRVPASELDV